MMKINEESFTSRMSSLVSGGSTMRNACGKTILRVAVIDLIPNDRAASTWPRGTAWIPARTVSAVYADATMPNASHAVPYGGYGILKPGMASGSRPKAMKMMIAGNPRKNSMYAVAIQRYGPT